jgi:hypothetical protein
VRWFAQRKVAPLEGLRHRDPSCFWRELKNSSRRGETGRRVFVERAALEGGGAYRVFAVCNALVAKWPNCPGEAGHSPSYLSVVKSTAVVALIVFFPISASGIALGSVGPATEGATPKVFSRTLVCSTGDGGPNVGGSPKIEGNPISGALFLERRYTGGSSTLAYAGTVGALVDKRYCALTVNRVPLTRKGLPADAIKFGSVTCPLGRVLVRLRYTYVAGARPREGVDVNGRLVSAFLAVRSYKTLKPLAFVRLTDSGRKFELYSAASCTV